MSADPYDHDPDAMQGYVALIGAILQRALADSRLRIRHGTQGHTHPTRADQEDARALLLSHERLRFFCELMGAEVSRVQACAAHRGGPALSQTAGGGLWRCAPPAPSQRRGSRSRLRPSARSLLKRAIWTESCSSLLPWRILTAGRTRRWHTNSP